MFKSLALLGAFLLGALAADDQLRIQKVTVNTPSGTISGKAVSSGDNLVFVDDNDATKSLTLIRGNISNYKTVDGAILVDLKRPAASQAGTVSNLRITVAEETDQATLTRWIGTPVERSRTVTTYSTDVAHDHGKGSCNGRLIADDSTLRFESITEASHSRTWNYNDLQSFKDEKDRTFLKVVAKNGEKYDLKAHDAATAGTLYDLVSQRVTSNRPVDK